MTSSPNWAAWASFLSAVQEAEDELDFENGEERFYRGHRRLPPAWGLLPTLMRRYAGENLDDAESALYWEFQARAKELHNLQLSQWDVLFFMRHHGVPTRILDWTESLAVAIYFALNDEPGATVTADASPCIWVMNPYLLNGEHGKKEDLYAPENLGWDEDERDYYGYGDLLLEPEDWTWESPVAIYPQQKPARMGAQRGWFTIHGSDRGPLETQRPDCVRNVRIPPEADGAAREILRISGIDQYGIYADLDGLAAALITKHSHLERPADSSPRPNLPPRTKTIKRRNRRQSK